MKLLFLGGTGIISTACTELAARSGFDLFLLNRGTKPAALPTGVNVLTADIHDPAQTAAALAGHTFDAVVQFIAYKPADIERDIALFRNITKQYVFISSASAYQRPAAHYLVTESTPLANPFWAYSRDKIACEERLMAEHRATGFPVTIVRPSLTYGRSMIPLALNSWRHPWTVPDRMLRGLPVLVHGDGESLWQTTHNTDFAKGLLGLTGQPRAIGEAFHITTDEVLTWNQYYQAVGRALGVEPKLVHIASETLCELEPNLSGGLLGDKASSVVLDNTKIKQFVPSYKATVTFQDGVNQAVAWFRSDPARQSVDPQFSEMYDQLLAAHARLVRQ
jgi:nucleoside-diphosphate-sugar epimerase